MEKFKTVLNIANKQANLSFGLVALLTAGGEQIFSSVVFSCPCSELNLLYGLVFLLVPALALLLLGYMLNKRTWRLLTGMCHKQAARHRCRRLAAAGLVLFQISMTALVAPSSWVAVALLHGKYYECAMTGTNVSAFNKHICGEQSQKQCEKELHRFPCEKDSAVPRAVREDVILSLKAQSQILGWLLIASILLSNLLLTCMARCSSPISYLQLKFWRVYAQEESSQFNSHISLHARELAERNVKCFFNQTEPEAIQTPSQLDWEKISALYRFSSREQYYSTLHRVVEGRQEGGSMMRMTSLLSNQLTDNNPAVLNFVDDGRMSL